MIFTSDLENKVFAKKSFRFFTRFKHSKILDCNHSCLCLCMCVWLSVCMCVCVCVCVCLCVYAFILFHRKSFFLCTNFLDILERDGSAILCCDCYIRLFYHVPSSPFLRMSYFTSKAKLQQLKNWREYDLIYCPCGRRYILM